MAEKLILTECVITVNGVDFTDHVGDVTVSMKKAAVDTTNFAGGGKEQQGGLKEDEFDIEFQQDFAAAEVNATLWPLYENGTEFTVTVKPFNAAVSTTNPLFSGTCILLEYTPLSGKVGALSTSKVKFPTQRTGISVAYA